MTLDHVSDGAKHIGDALSLAAVVGTLIQILPSVAALFTIIWTLIRITETVTFRALFYKWFGVELGGWLTTPHTTENTTSETKQKSESNPDAGS